MKNVLRIIAACLFLLTSCKQDNFKPGIVKEELQPVKKLCFIKNFYSKEKDYVTLDFIELIKTGDLDSKVTYPQIIELPDKYCYVNKEIKIEDFELSDSVKIIMQTFSYDSEGNYNFKQSITLKGLLNEIGKFKQIRFLKSPYEVEIVNNKIISLTEIYIP